MEMNHTKAYYRVIFGDTDAMKIVYNANYLRFFEIGRNEFLRELGFPYAELNEKYDLHFPLAESHVKYRKPAWYDDMLEIRCMVLELKNASVTIGYEILNRDTQELLVTGWTKHAFGGRQDETRGAAQKSSGAGAGDETICRGGRNCSSRRFA